MKALETGIASQRWDLAAHALVIGLLKAEMVRPPRAQRAARRRQTAAVEAPVDHEAGSR